MATQIGILPQSFALAVHDLSQFDWDPRILVAELEPPAKLAAHTAALDADVLEGGEPVGSGRLILLHEPDGNEAWQGDFRCVTFARADVSPDMVEDPFLAQVGWSWLMDALESRGAKYVAASGTVTTTASTPFGGIEDRQATSEIEIRASWTPLLDPSHPFTDHVAAWQVLLREVCGLPADNEVISLNHRIAARR
ncbi:MAG: DUF3000 domain-containing protein [Propionibacteriaceae bacterium]|jgi:hypothetical protein|nr:DUF3000 domain-containing protein [Propionibacteriaceae bacterium]